MNAAVLVLAGLLLLGQKWETPAIFQRKPHTEQLAAAQQQLEAAKAAQAAAEAALAAARAEEQAKKDAQLTYAQQMSTGATAALHRVPVEHQIAEVILATELSERATAGLEAARGKLTPAQQTEVESWIARALSAKADEVAAYKKALAIRDAELAAATTERATLAAKIPTLEASLQVKAAEVAAVSTRVQTETAKVADYADKFAAERAKNGSLSAYAGNLGRILVGLFALYLVAGFLLPGFLKHLEAGPLKTALRNLSGYSLNPLLFHDAKKKLSFNQSAPPTS